MMKEIVSLETTRTTKNKSILKQTYFDASEFDIEVYHSKGNCCDICEVKHALERNK